MAAGKWGSGNGFGNGKKLEKWKRSNGYDFKGSEFSKWGLRNDGREMRSIDGR